MIRLLNAVATLDSIKTSDTSSVDVATLEERCSQAMEDDMNTAKLIGLLLGGVTIIHKLAEGKESIAEKELEKLKNIYFSWVYSVLGLEQPEESGKANEITGDLITMILNLRNDAKSSRDFETADRIRKELTNMGITVKDRKDGADWEIN